MKNRPVFFVSTLILVAVFFVIKKRDERYGQPALLQATDDVKNPFTVYFFHIDKSGITKYEKPRV